MPYFMICKGKEGPQRMRHVASAGNSAAPPECSTNTPVGAHWQACSFPPDSQVSVKGTTCCCALSLERNRNMSKQLTPGMS